MEVVHEEDGFNVVSLRCDHCETEVPQIRQADEDWFQVTLEPLSRDHWNKKDKIGEFHFCSSDCYRSYMMDHDPFSTTESGTE